MRRDQLEHAIRTACQITGLTEVIIAAAGGAGVDVPVRLRNPLLIGANDAPRSDVGKVALGEFVVGVVVEDYEASGRRGAADQQIDDR
jgi:hypothetical protein